MKSSAHKSGFTLVELLVVIAIIGTLIGLLLPAVQNAREAGRRNSCMNNLSQLAKAVMSFEGQRQSLPGWRNAHPNVSGTQAPSWPVVILPNLERSDVYRNLQQIQSLTPSSGAPSIPLFICPTSPGGAADEPTLSYAGNCGSTGRNLTQQIRGDGVMLDTLGNTSQYAAARSNLDMISGADGTTNTLLFSEKCGSLSAQSRWNNEALTSTNNPFILPTGTSGGMFSQPAMSSGDIPVFGIGHDWSSALTEIVNSKASPTQSNLSYSAHPSSSHPGVVCASFCDGHTAVVRDSIAAHVYAQLVTSDSQWQAGGASIGGSAQSAPNGEYTTNSKRVNDWLQSNGVKNSGYMLNSGDF